MVLRPRRSVSMRAPPARKGLVQTVRAMMRSACARTSGSGTSPSAVAIIGMAGWHADAGAGAGGAVAAPFTGGVGTCVAAPATPEAASIRLVLVRKSRRRIAELALKERLACRAASIRSRPQKTPPPAPHRADRGSGGVRDASVGGHFLGAG